MIIFHLQEILNKEGLSQNQFSKLSGVRPNTVNNICKNNLKRLELSTLEKIMETLSDMGYSVEDIIKYNK
ncbi:hypothetical protein HMPREF2873_05250 [Staphylococcus sp. HMSC075H09]|nr:hypothetical protein HMPREF2873_05250 [Staphylococcus sp. HMSC075H09]